MGKIVKVIPPFDSVLLPSNTGWSPYRTNAQVTLTDAEYAALPAATARAISLVQSNTADPVRPSTSGNPQSLSDAVTRAQAYTDSKLATLASSNSIHLATSEDASSTATVLGGTFAVLTPTVEVVVFPDPTLFVWLQWGCGTQVTAAGNGAAFIGVGEINIGTGVYTLYDSAGVNGGFLAGTWSKYGAARGMCPLGIVSSTARIFRLGGQLGADSGTPGVSVRSRSAASTSPRTFLTAWGMKVA